MSVVLAGYVATPEGESALAHAVAEAGRRGARLVVVCSHRSDGDGHPSGETHEQESQRLHAQLSDAGVEFEIRTLVRGFEPAEDLIALAEVTGAELIVIGMRRRTPIGKFIMGSNAQRVLMDANCPVLAVKA